MARVERGIAQQQGLEQQLLQGEVVFSKQLTLRELLKIKPGEEGETKYLLNDAPFDFEIRDLGDSFLHAASFPERQALSGDGFFSLLEAAKSGGALRTGQGIGGTNADWRIILPEVREEEKRAKELYDYHTKYVPGFTEFEQKHFKKFWDMLSPLSDEEDGFFRRQFRRFISKEKLLSQYGLEFYQTSRGLRPISLSFDYRSAFVRFLNSRNLGHSLDPNSSIFAFREATELALNKLPKSEREKLLGDFYKQLASVRGEVKLAFAGADANTYGDDRTIITDENGEPQDFYSIHMRGQPFPSGADSIKGIGNGQVEVRKGNSYLRVGFEKDKDTGHEEAIVRDKSIACHIAPLIVWKKDKKTGIASYSCEAVTHRPRHDTLLGQLVVSAYSQEQRDQMPREITVKDKNGNKITQQMLEAQSVLLVTMPEHAERFLTKSPVILGLEAMAKKG